MKALIIPGGWDGHEPETVANFFDEKLKAEGFEVTIADTLDVFNDAEALKSYDLISPCWTMGELD